MPETREITVYRAQELRGAARTRALDWLAEGNTSGDWSEAVIEDAKTCGKLFGIEMDDILWSGFGCQGDGACFTGRYGYVKDAIRAIRAHAPQDAELHRIVQTLQKIQRRNFYRATARISKQSWRYSHERAVAIEIYDTKFEGDDDYDGILAEALRDFMRWVYQQLEQEYEYQISEEACLESAEANEYRFTETGQPV